MSSDSIIDNNYEGHDCVTGSLVGYSSSSGNVHIIPMFCHAWTCPRCRKQKASKWRSIAGRGKPDRFITLTFRRDPDISQKQTAFIMKKALTKTVQECRKRFGEFEYLCVWELTKKGTPHIHMLQRGDFVPKKELSKIWCKYTGSFIVDMRQIWNEKSIYAYLTKYMGKSIGKTAEALNGMRVIQKSQNYVILPEDDTDAGDVENADVIDCWLYCTATPKEIVECAIDIFECSLDERSEFDHLVLRAPPDEDIASKIVHHFDDDRSYN